MLPDNPQFVETTVNCRGDTVSKMPAGLSCLHAGVA